MKRARCSRDTLCTKHEAVGSAQSSTPCGVTHLLRDFHRAHSLQHTKRCQQGVSTVLQNSALLFDRSFTMKVELKLIGHTLELKAEIGHTLASPPAHLHALLSLGLLLQQLLLARHIATVALCEHVLPQGCRHPPRTLSLCSSKIMSSHACALSTRRLMPSHASAPPVILVKISGKCGFNTILSLPHVYS